MAEAEPVAGRHVALGDRKIAGQPSFRREQIVAIGVECPVGDRKADRQQLAVGIEQEGKIHLQRDLSRHRLEPRKAGRHYVRIGSEIADVAVDRRARSTDPEAQVGIGVVGRFGQGVFGGFRERLDPRPIGRRATIRRA